MTHRPLLPTYSEYKPTRVLWLDEIPAHWNDLPLKRIATFRSGAGFPLQEQGQQDLELPFYKVSDMNLPGNEKTMKTENNSVSRSTAAKLSAYIFPQGTIIFPKVGGAMLTNKRRILERQSCIDNNLMGCIVTHADPNFVFFLLQNTDFALIANPGPLPAINARDVKNIRVPYPPIEEQAAIARYLTHKDTLIQRFLQGKRRMLDLLKQLRKSTIHYAVIHGLDPDNTPMKPSGIPWLDEIPAHWQTIPLKHWVRINQAVLPENTDPNYEFRYIDIGSIGTGVRVEEPEKMRFETAPSRARRIVRNGDTIFSTVRTYLKAVWFADDPDDDLICSTGFAVFTPRQNTSPKFVSYVAQSDSFINRVTANSFGVTYPAINTSRLGSLRVPVPPLDEQAAIAEYLDDRIAKIDAATAGTSRLIDLMEQYRKSLIHELVTGARDVRKVAATIPDPDDPTPNPPTP